MSSSAYVIDKIRLLGFTRYTTYTFLLPRLPPLAGVSKGAGRQLRCSLFSRPRRASWPKRPHASPSDRRAPTSWCCAPRRAGLRHSSGDARRRGHLFLCGLLRSERPLHRPRLRRRRRRPRRRRSFLLIKAHVLRYIYSRISEIRSCFSFSQEVAISGETLGNYIQKSQPIFPLCFV